MDAPNTRRTSPQEEQRQTPLDKHRARQQILSQAVFRNEELELGLLFDHRWYITRYLHKECSFGRALAHFLTKGLQQEHDASPFFSTLYYLGQFEFTSWPLNILLHYVRVGAAGGLNPCPLFDSPWYYARYEVAAAGLTPLAHFIQAARQGIMHDPNEFFNAALYAKEQNLHGQYPHPLFHYLENARSLRVRPSARFDTAAYLLRYADVEKSDINPLEHYLRSGRFEGRNAGSSAVKYHEDKLRLEEFRNTPAGRRLVFYTAVIGDGSGLLPPEALVPGARYVCFTDSPQRTYGIWTIRPLSARAGESPQEAVRRCRLHPQELFPDAELAVWAHSNIVLCGDMEPYIRQTLDNGLPLGIIRSPQAGCAREAASGLDDDCLIISDLRHPALPLLYELWRQALSTQDPDDQMSLSRVLDRLQLTLREFLPKGLAAGDGKDCIFLSQAGARAVKVPDAVFPAEVGFPSLPITFAEFRRRHPDCFDAVRDRRADVIVAVHNAPDYTRACLTSVLPTLREADGLILVNDVSDEATSALLREFAASDPRIRLIENERNLGYTGSANRGLRASDAPFRVMLNSDTLVCAGWLEKMLMVAYCDETTGIVGPLSSAASYQSIPFLEFTANNTPINALPKGKTTADMDSLCEGAAPYGMYPSVPLIHGFCFGIRREVIDKIGFFDEIAFARFFGEENDYCIRAKDAGFTLRAATPVYVFHAKSKSITEEIRAAFVGEAGNTLRRLYGATRIEADLHELQANALLAYMRNISAGFYHFCEKNLDRYVKKMNAGGFVVEQNGDLAAVFNDKARIRGRQGNTLGTMYEVFVKECYAFFCRHECIVYDIGFNIGCAAIYFALYDTVKHIYAFEPFRQTYRQGMENLAANEKLAEKITVFNFGLGDKDGVFFRRYNEDAPGSMSSVTDIFQGNYPVEEIVVKNAAEVLRPLFAAHSEHIVLKIDCEGAEKDILSSLAREKLLADVTAVSLEWHFAYPEHIIGLLKENNFFVFFSHESHDDFGMIHAVNTTKYA